MYRSNPTRLRLPFRPSSPLHSFPAAPLFCMQTPECSEYHPSALSPVVSALSLTNSLFLNCRFIFVGSLTSSLKHFSFLKTKLSFCPILRGLCVCLCVCVCVCVCVSDRVCVCVCGGGGVMERSVSVPDNAQLLVCYAQVSVLTHRREACASSLHTHTHTHTWRGREREMGVSVEVADHCQFAGRVLVCCATCRVGFTVLF